MWSEFEEIGSHFELLVRERERERRVEERVLNLLAPKGFENRDVGRNDDG